MDQKPEIRIIILDIEGTTTPITFISEVLFPYIRKQLKNYLETTWETPQTQSDVDALRQLYCNDRDSGLNVPIILESGEKSEIISSILSNVFAQMDADRKTTALKQLQGHVWKSGFESGELKGTVYDDVLVAFKSWSASNSPIYIYSSGSIAAQKLLFNYSTFGNLSNYLKDHFDTTTGPKTEKSSYESIFTQIQATYPSISKSNVLFVTDNINESFAANDSGINTILSIRPGTMVLPENHPFKTITSFNELWNHYEFVSI